MAKEIYSLDMCEMQSFSYDNLLRTRKAFPELKIMITAGHDCTDETLDRCIKDKFDLDMFHGRVTKEIVDKFHNAGLTVALWTANVRDVLDYCVSLGVDYIESDYFSSELGE